jgi:hypothetical protein
MRTLTSTGPTVAYTSAQQVADFGSNQLAIHARIYQVSSSVGMGYPLQTSITQGAPAATPSVLLLSMDSSGLTDAYGHAVTLVGNVARSGVSYAPLIGNIYSASFDGAGDYLTFPWSSEFVFGTGDFTVEAWIQMAAQPADKVVVDAYKNGSSTWQVLVSAAGKVVFYEANPNGAASTGTASVSDGAWHHIAVCRTGSTLMTFVDGALDKSVANSKNHANAADYLAIGAQVTTRNAAYDFAGYIDEVRLTKGVSRYTGAFARPTRPFTE